MKFFDRKDSVNNRLLIEDRGASRIKRLAQAATSKSTTQKVVELAWTAGPVTLIASFGGYYMGNGKLLPTNTLIFFIGYTVIAGVVGLAAHLFNRLKVDTRQEEVQGQLMEAMGALPDLILELRDAYLSTLEPEQRHLEATRILLQEVDLGPRWLSHAVKNVGGSADLVAAAEAIDLYRRAGMGSCSRDIYEVHRDEFEALIAGLAEQSARLAEALASRLRGRRQLQKLGVPRDEYFIERVLAAIDDDDDNLMTVEDVEEMLTLLFELLCGRRIPMLSFNYIGHWKLARATDELESERLKFRIVRARGYNRLLALSTYLNEQLPQDDMASPLGLKGADLLTYCRERMVQLVAEVDEDPHPRPDRVVALEQALSLYHRAFIANQKVAREYADFLKDIERWKRETGGRSLSEVAIENKPGRTGLQIVEDHIELDDRDKVRAVSRLAPHFRRLSRQLAAGNGRRSVQGGKQLAIQIALVLDDLIHIRRPEVQRAIGSSNTLNMGLFEKGLSNKTKIGLGEALSKEIVKDMARAGEALAGAIYRYYGLELDEAARATLARRYGTSEEHLARVYSLIQPVSAGVTQAPVQPLNIPKAPLAWRLALAHARV